MLLSDWEIPDRSIGAGETLRSIQWVALYDDWNEGIRRILAVVQAEPEGEPLDSRQQNAYSEGDLVYFMPRSTADLLNDRKRERRAEKFSLVHDDRSIREYTRQEVDTLTPTQREKLFAADPEIAAWWRGKSPMSGAWPLFRLRGGTWISKDQIKQTPQEHQGALWEIPDLLEWYMQDLVF